MTDQTEYTIENFYVAHAKTANQTLSVTYTLKVKDPAGVYSLHQYITKSDYHSPNTIESINLYFGADSVNNLYVGQP